MSKTFVWSNEAKTALFENAEGLESLLLGGSLVFLTAAEATVATVALSATNALTTANGVANVQRSTDVGFNGTSVTPSADGTVTHAELRKSDTTVVGTCQVRRSDAGDAGDAVFTFNTVDWNTLTDVDFNADFTISYP